MHDILIVGAGVAGLAAAGVLHKAGLAVRLVEKSRGVGGRLATRRVATASGEVRLDHGAQYFTCRSEAFWQVVQPLIADGEIALWLDGVPTLKQGILEPPDAAHRSARYICPQGMTALARVLTHELDIRLETKATALALEENGCWRVTTDRGAEIARAVLLTPPPQQSLAIAGEFGNVSAFDPARAVDFLPCLAVMAGYGAADPGGLPWGLRWEDDPIVAWSALDSSKRRDPKATTIVVHTLPDFSREHFDAVAEKTAQRVLEHCACKLGGFTPLALARPEWVQVHRWRYAMPANPLDAAFLARMGPAPLLLAGCWCSGARVEGAFLSGQAAGRELVQCLTAS
ncbi:MAG: FAD-dependent oxidoreductase [Aphanocapsa lilacina HA4352-LM1]|jgi:predicted NAD/FAD-dependent oxidoreductase|nr:FAD-dependent oxidoreductase [Aphanocapsa lilacina HA4352-LM1]